MTKQKHSNISSALHNALEQYQELVGHDFPVVPKLTVHKSKDFWALTEMVDGDLTSDAVLSAKLSAARASHWSLIAHRNRLCLKG